MEKETAVNVFNELSKVDCSAYVETIATKRTTLKYLSWADAWTEVKMRYPFVNYKVYETEGGCIYFNDGRTAWVKVGVTINDLEYIEYLPVMDSYHNSIPLDKITSFEVNKAIQRALTKAIGRHGLGLYIYRGEDLPRVAYMDETDLLKAIKSCSTREELNRLWKDNAHLTKNKEGEVYKAFVERGKGI